MSEWHNPALGDVDTFLRENDKFAWYMAERFRQSGQRMNIDMDELYSSAQFGMLKAYKMFNPDVGVKWSSFAARVMNNEILMLLRKAKRSPITLSLDTVLNVDDSGNEFTLGEALRGVADVDISESLFLEFMQTRSERDREIVRMKLAGYNQQQIANELGFTKSHTSRLLLRIKRNYEKGEWRVARTITGDVERAKELIRTTQLNNLAISNQTGVKVNRVRILRSEVDTNRQPKATPAPVGVAKTIEINSTQVHGKQSDALLVRISALRRKLVECVDELDAIESEVAPIINAKSEMSEMAKKLLVLVG